MSKQYTEDKPLPGLTGRQQEILQGLADGDNVNQIADRLAISDETVRTHIKRTTSKLGARSRIHAVVLALRRGHIS